MYVCMYVCICIQSATTGNPSLQMYDGLGLASSEESQMHLLPRGPAPAGGGSISGRSRAGWYHAGSSSVW